MGSQGYKSLRRLRNLEIVDLSENAFTNSIFPFLSAATSLKSLFLGNNRMVGSFPVDELKYLTNLELLDLRINRFNGSTPVQEVSALRKLNALDLSDNEFSSSTELQGICKMKNMQELDLSGNKLVGNLQSLKYLSLVDNNFDNLSKLRVLILGSKSKSFQVESKSFWKPKFRLSHIALPSCNLEKVPHFLQYQKDLSHIDLSDNKISGIFPHWLLVNNTKLESLLLQNNSFTSFQLP
ncbi:PREDICTED: receptor-like protein 2 isoform X4 [Brassica oleracea var. oleracea]|uniref:receptor-like protein 2 isoform X4 n=1 Tax=Brassica oleracea var. oleracea TaxID=109376 RepID=UPI0006A73932|nr:PREDICTED: receptor-like protein 2 isoform X4 [Brassica oleracea var. oleracea]